MSISIREQLSSRMQKIDGKDHINVSIFAAKTQLGRILHPEFRKKFFVPKYGEYLSPMCFLRWIGGAGEEARYNDKAQGWQNVACFQEAIVYSKFCQFKKMRSELVEELNKHNVSTFTSYKMHPGGIRESDRKWEWFIKLLPELISQAVEPERKVPDWEQLGFSEDSLKKIEEDIKKFVVSQYQDEESQEDEEVDGVYAESIDIETDSSDQAPALFKPVEEYSQTEESQEVSQED